MARQVEDQEEKQGQVEVEDSLINVQCDNIEDINECKGIDDQISEKISMEEIPGKGQGCVAVDDLAPGALVLREEPALYVTPDLDGHAETICAFAELTVEEQNKLLKLCNVYTMEESLWTHTMRKELDVCVEDAGDISSTGITTETAR